MCFNLVLLCGLSAFVPAYRCVTMGSFCRAAPGP
jgi:hypothetical protein